MWRACPTLRPHATTSIRQVPSRSARRLPRPRPWLPCDTNDGRAMRPPTPTRSAVLAEHDTVDDDDHQHDSARDPATDDCGCGGRDGCRDGRRLGRRLRSRGFRCSGHVRRRRRRVAPRRHVRRVARARRPRRRRRSRSPARGRQAVRSPSSTRAPAPTAVPLLTWTTPPDDTVEVALVVTDESADDFAHWIVIALPPEAGSVGGPEPLAVGTEATNSGGEIGWAGPCPPDAEPHTYRFTLYALSQADRTATGVAAGRSDPGDRGVRDRCDVVHRHVSGCIVDDVAPATSCAPDHDLLPAPRPGGRTPMHALRPAGVHRVPRPRRHRQPVCRLRKGQPAGRAHPCPLLECPSTHAGHLRDHGRQRRRLRVDGGSHSANAGTGGRITYQQALLGLGRQPRGRYRRQPIIIVELHEQWYRLVSSGFLHYGIIHIAFNMILLFQLGQLLEPSIGRVKFGLVYLAALLGGSAGGLILEPNGLHGGASGRRVRPPRRGRGR